MILILRTLYVLLKGTGFSDRINLYLQFWFIKCWRVGKFSQWFFFVFSTLFIRRQSAVRWEKEGEHTRWATVSFSCIFKSDQLFVHLVWCEIAAGTHRRVAFRFRKILSEAKCMWALIKYLYEKVFILISFISNNHIISNKNLYVYFRCRAL